MKLQVHFLTMKRYYFINGLDCFLSLLICDGCTMRLCTSQFIFLRLISYVSNCICAVWLVGCASGALFNNGGIYND